MDIAPNRWSPWTWVLLVAAVVAQLIVGCIATAIVSLGTVGVCHEPATTDDLAQARIGLLVVVALSVAPWLVGLVVTFRRRRYRVPLAVAALVVTAVPAWYLTQVLAATPADWSLDWCMF